jgi:hypothetical protein
MRKTFAIALTGLVALSLPALAAPPAFDVNDNAPAGEGVTVRVDCEGGVIWDTGMFDEFTPPPGCATAASSQCFIDAINDGGFPADGRRLADDFTALSSDPITGVKIWARYNAPGYGYHLEANGLHGYCVKFYGFTDCPDGSVPGEEAIGPILYSNHVTDYVEEEIFTGLIRNFNSCINLCPPFVPETDVQYWVSVSADFDFTTWEGDPSAGTQWFWRAYPGLGISFCEASWWDSWTPGGEINWGPVSVQANVPCWATWDASFVLYNAEPCQVEAACCVDGLCRVTTEADCATAGGTWFPDQPTCDGFECPPVATQESSWGSIKANYR